MIKTKNLVPEVYFNKSRDFQFLAHIYEVVFNYLKTNIDSIYNVPFSKNSDKHLTNLVAYTLGFKPRHKYNDEQLTAVCSIFSYILKNKGSKKSLEWVIKALYRLEGLPLDDNTVTVLETMEPVYDRNGVNYIEAKCVELHIRPLQNRILLEDVLDYILPAGTLYRIVDLGELSVNENQPHTNSSTSDSIKVTIRTNPNAVPTLESVVPTSLGANDNIWVSKIESVSDAEDEVITQPEEPNIEE